MTPESKLTRRLLLRGAGTVAIGLPLLEEFMPKAHADQTDAIPCRLFTMSFGLGIERAMQLEQFTGPLEPLAALASKAAFFTRVDARPLDGGGTPHFSTGAATFTGVPQFGENGDYLAGGPSMEQVMKRALHPGGVPNVSVPELSAGMWSRTGAKSQYYRHWNDASSPGREPERRPSRVFSALFGMYMPPGEGELPPAQLAERHLHRSVLDTVMDQYDGLTSANSPLGAISKARIDNHLSSIRDVERQLAPNDDDLGPLLECVPPSEADYTDPQPYSFYDNDSGPAGPGAPQISWQVADDAMRLIGELMALGAACDALRFGSLLCVGAGGHIRFSGEYQALGESMDFTSRFAGGTPHDVIFHAYSAPEIRLYQHFVLRQLSHMLLAMDALDEPNGQTLLDNSVVLLGTEYGEDHSGQDALHAVIGGGDRFNAGFYDQAILPSDVYHQALGAYGVDSGIPALWPEYTPVEINGFRNV